MGKLFSSQETVTLGAGTSLAFDQEQRWLEIDSKDWPVPFQNAVPRSVSHYMIYATEDCHIRQDDGVLTGVDTGVTTNDFLLLKGVMFRITVTDHRNNWLHVTRKTNNGTLYVWELASKDPGEDW